jgi:hypothetical protein
MTAGEKELFNEKIKGIYAALDANANINNEHFKRITEYLERIEAQTMKTNGRVSNAEEKIHTLELMDKDHYVKCPQIPRIDKLEVRATKFSLIEKYPVIFLVGVVVFGAAVIVGFLAQIGII